MPVFGFIGTGNMGGALARAARKTLSGEELLLSNRSPEKAQALAEELGCRAVDNRAAALEADYLLLGVKPQMMESLFQELRPLLRERKTPAVLVSMAAGISVGRIRSLAETSSPVIRILPNTPCSIGAGLILYCPGEDVPPEVLEVFLRSMAGAGRFVRLEEHQIDAGCAISGCGPAFADLFMEALADGGVTCGLPRSAALELAAGMLSGSAQLALSSGAHPAVLKDAVCSPGGSTIQGVRTLERAGFRSAVMEAVISSFEKNQALG